MQKTKAKKTIKQFENKIICGDILKSLKEIPSGKIDLVFADPPFNLNKKYSASGDKKSTIEYLNWCYDWIDECIRILKPTGTLLLHNIPKWLVYFANHLNEQEMVFKHWIAWDAPGTPLGKTLYPTHYGILYYTKSEKDYTFNNLRIPHKRCRVCKEVQKDYGGKKVQMHPFGPILSDVWSDLHRIRHKTRRDSHPNQLPEPLMERLVMMCSNKNDIVLDPLIGTGTTALAAKRLGRKYIGIDNSKDYVKVSKEKLKEIDSKDANGYIYKYNKKGQTKTSVNKNFAKTHTIPDSSFIIDKKELKEEKTSMYYDFDLEISKE
jgi:site-specific DNA-methyltransferase (adenine-specific)